MPKEQPSDPTFIVRFSCLVLTGNGDETTEHELAQCLIQAKSAKHAEQWGKNLRYKFVNEEPDTGPSISEEDQVTVEVESVHDFMTTLAKNAATLSSTT